ncbi:MAG: prolipoprotein diacylglyceryl transferase [Armatimonadota bacterium]
MYSKLFSIGPVTIHAYGVMLTVGFVAGILWMRREGRQKGMGTDAVLDFALWTLLSSVLCARALFVLLNWSEFAASPRDIVWLWRGGLSFHGGVLGAIGAGSIFAVRRKIPFGTLSDAAAPAIPLGYAFARIGCFMNGCCQGSPTDLPWRYPQAPATDAYGVLIHPSHPAQIYDSLMSLAVFGLILLLKPHFRARGQLFAAYVAIYSLERYIIEFWRAGSSAAPFAPLAPLTQAQVASVVVGVVAAAFLLVEEWARLNRAAEPSANEPSDAEAEEPEVPSRPKKVHR